MKIEITSPSKAFINEATQEEFDRLKKLLSYTNTANQHLLKRHYNNHWAKSKNPKAWQDQLESLKASVHNTLIFEENEKKFIRPGSLHLIEEGGLCLEISNKVTYPTPKKIAWAKPLPFELHHYQDESAINLVNIIHGNVELCTGCHAKGTKILMFDGILKNVEDIKAGDQLMGPDSNPREVLELHRGQEEMFEINPVKGEPFVVNRSHILSLQRTNLGNTYLKKDKTRSSQKNGPNPILNISVEEYLKLSNNNKHVYKLYRASIEFKAREILKIPPYILGLWLGDGASSRCSLTTMDKEIRNVWCKYVADLGLTITVDNKKNNKAKTYNGIIGNYVPVGRSKNNEVAIKQNKFHILLDTYGLINNKHIPIQYLTASKQDRLQLLAGLIDTDGYFGNGYYEIIQKNIELANNIVYLARSLGFGATKINKKSKDQNGTEGIYVRINIFGDISLVPTLLIRKRANQRKQIKNVLRTGFKVKSIGLGEYFGFSVDSDKLYLMGDFTVAHNSGKSAILLKICRETGFRTAIIAPSKSIFLELLEKFEYHFGKSMVGTYGNGKKKLGKRFTICIGDSIANIKPNTEEWEFFSTLDMLCVDESHTWGADTLEAICHGVLENVPYRLFFSGTQTRGDGAEKLLHSIIGKTVYTLTTQEAVTGGYICPHDYRIVEVESSNPNYMTADVLDMKRVHFLRNRNICAFIAKLANAEATTYRRQVLVLVEELSQIAALLPLLKVPTTIAHSETKPARLAELGLTKVDRQESVEKFNKGEALVLIGTSCVSVGTNIYPTHHTINWVGGASEIKTKQGAVGRSVRLGSQNPWANRCAPKTKATIWDFNVHDIYVMVRHLEDRLSYYADSGSEIKRITLRK